MYYSKILVALLQFTPYIYRFLTEGVIFSGNGDGFTDDILNVSIYTYVFPELYDHSFD